MCFLKLNLLQICRYVLTPAMWLWECNLFASLFVADVQLYLVSLIFLCLFNAECSCSCYSSTRWRCSACFPFHTCIMLLWNHWMWWYLSWFLAAEKEWRVDHFQHKLVHPAVQSAVCSGPSITHFPLLGFCCLTCFWGCNAYGPENRSVYVGEDR